MKPEHPNPVTETNILDGVVAIEKDILSRSASRILIAAIMLVCLLNLFLTTVGVSASAKTLYPEMNSSLRIISRTSVPILIIIPLGCLMLASLISFLPFRRKSYSQKLNAAMVLLLLAVEGLLTVLLLTDYFRKLA